MGDLLSFLYTVVDTLSLIFFWMHLPKDDGIIGSLRWASGALLL